MVIVLAELVVREGLPGRPASTSRSREGPPLSSRSVSFSLSLGVSVCAPTVRSLRVRLRLVDFSRRVDEVDPSRGKEERMDRETERERERDRDRARR